MKVGVRHGVCVWYLNSLRPLIALLITTQTLRPSEHLALEAMATLWGCHRLAVARATLSRTYGHWPSRLRCRPLLTPSAGARSDRCT